MALEKLQAYRFSLPSAEVSDSQASTSAGPSASSDDSSELESEETEETLTTDWTSDQLQYNKR